MQSLILVNIQIFAKNPSIFSRIVLRLLIIIDMQKGPRNICILDVAKLFTVVELNSPSDHHPDLDVKLSCDHVEHFRIGHFKAKLVACDDLILSIFF